MLTFYQQCISQALHRIALKKLLYGKYWANVYFSKQRFFTLFHLMCAEMLSEVRRLPDYFFGLSRQINIGTLGH